MQVDLNADVGESSGDLVVGDDRGILQSVTSASVAAGVHAGDPTVLRNTIRLAHRAGVAVGAHPGLPDCDGHGRRELSISPADAEDLVLYQLAAVAGVAAAEGVALQHVKLHGALYNMAARKEELAAAIVRAVAAFDRELIVFGPPDSALTSRAQAEGLAIAAEFFADRAYEADGSLVARGRPGALLTTPGAIAARVLQVLREGTVAAADGTTIRMKADTVCVHSDTPDAAGIAREVRGALDRAGIVVSRLRAPRGARGAAPFQ